MKEQIEIMINDEDDLYEVYNRSIIKRELMDYIIYHINPYQKKSKLELIIYGDIPLDNVEELLKSSFRKEYNKQIKIHNYNNNVQYAYLGIGILILLLAMLVENNSILHEILLIGGWVSISETFELELFADVENRKRKLILKRLLNCTITIKR